MVELFCTLKAKGFFRTYMGPMLTLSAVPYGFSSPVILESCILLKEIPQSSYVNAFVSQKKAYTLANYLFVYSFNIHTAPFLKVLGVLQNIIITELQTKTMSNFLYT